MRNTNYAHFSYNTIDIYKMLSVFSEEQIDEFEIEVINAESLKCITDQVCDKYDVYEKNDGYFSFIVNNKKCIKSKLNEIENEIKIFLSYNPEHICIVANRNKKKCWGIDIICDESVVTILSYDEITNHDIVKLFRCCFN